METIILSNNPPKRIATASFVVALLGVVMIFVPNLAGINGFDCGFAISVLSLFVAVSAVIVGAMHVGLAKKLDAILRGENVLAHWTYDAYYWREYAEKEYEEEKSEKKGLFLIVSGFALFFGILFWVFDPEAGFIVFLVMIGLIGLVAFAWRFSAWHNYKQNLSGVKEAYITKDAVYLNKRLYTWTSVLTSFDDVTQKKQRGLSTTRVSIYSCRQNWTPNLQNPGSNS